MITTPCCALISVCGVDLWCVEVELEGLLEESRVAEVEAEALRQQESTKINRKQASSLSRATYSTLLQAKAAQALQESLQERTLELDMREVKAWPWKGWPCWDGGRY